MLVAEDKVQWQIWVLAVLDLKVLLLNLGHYHCGMVCPQAFGWRR